MKVIYYFRDGRTVFSELVLDRIEMRIKEGNSRSKLIPERLGFKLEGILRRSEYLRGIPYDVLIYGLIREEWNG
jgi:ribosomal-protein-serine acetyltransferase